MKSYREDCNEARDARRGITEQREIKPKVRKKVPKPFVLEYQDINVSARYRKKWGKWDRYPTRELADAAMARQARKITTWNWRVVQRT